MTYLPIIQPRWQVPAGQIDGVTGVNKFGRCTDVDQALHDIWDIPGTATWVAPTAARIHDIASTSASDDGAPVGVGARTIRVWGLTAWGAAEVSEDIIMNGVGNVPTQALVIIHRMQVLTKGASGPNVGTITATAQVDGTITAQINIGEGQTQMAIYGVPSVRDAYLSCWYASQTKTGGAAASVDMRLLVNPEPDAELLGFLVKGTAGMISTGSTRFQHFYDPYFKVPGPAIIKVDAIASANDNDLSAGFDLYLVDNT